MIENYKIDAWHDTHFSTSSCALNMSKRRKTKKQKNGGGSMHECVYIWWNEGST